MKRFYEICPLTGRRANPAGPFLNLWLNLRRFTRKVFK